MRLGLVAAVAAVTVTAQAHAATPTPTSAPQAKEGGRVVLICDRSAKTRRALEEKHGAPVVFMSAEQLARAQMAKETWTTPRCITAAELQRYEQSADEARVLNASGG